MASSAAVATVIGLVAKKEVVGVFGVLYFVSETADIKKRGAA